MASFKDFFHIPKRLIIPVIFFGGIIFGMVAYIFYMSRAHSYLSDDPSACVNCHIMTPYYQTWFHSSHAAWATCSDCHVPQDNFFSKWFTKARDGAYHTAVFTLRTEPLAIRAKSSSSKNIMDNCIRCHLQLNTAFVSTGMINYTEARAGAGKACWDCHAHVPHGKISSIASTPNAIVTPLPQSPIPDWLRKLLNQ